MSKVRSSKRATVNSLKRSAAARIVTMARALDHSPDAAMRDADRRELDARAAAMSAMTREDLEWRLS